MPKAEWPAPGAEPVAGRTAKLRAVNCDLCGGSGTGPRCVYACPHDAAHRLPGERVLALAEAAAAPRTSAGLWATVKGLLRGPAAGE